MLVSGIKSRPTYASLEPDPNARRHLIAAQGEGALAVTDLVARAADGFCSRATILFDASGVGSNHVDQLRALSGDDFREFPTTSALLAGLNRMLATETMGTRLYVAGIEGFVGQVTQLAMSHGVDHRSIRTEHRGSLVRRVYCIHCKSVTEDVTTQVIPCSKCGVNLLVRDHYSRRLGAFMGVSVDAEVPGELPPVQEIFR